MRPPGITKWITGIGHDATAANAHFTSLKASACAKGDIDGAIPSAVVFSGSITGVGSTSGDALTNAMHALGIYSAGQYGTYGSGLNADRISPVNSSGGAHLNFFATGATTYSGGVSSGITPLALFDPYDSAAINLGWTSRILYKSALLNVPAADICESDITSSNCPEISASSSIHTLHDDCDSTDCEIRILENGGLGVSTNWVAAVSGVRKSMYEAIRQRLVEQEYNDENAEGVDCHDLSTGTYSFSDIGTSIAVFPNINALCSIEESNNEIAWSDGCDVLNPSAWSSNGLRTASQADAAISHSDVGGSNIYQIINLKDWTAGTGDKDIYVMEEVNMVNNTLYDAEAQCEGLAAGRSGDAERDLVRYGYRTAIFTPQSMSNLSGAIFGSGGGGGTITSTTALIAPTVVTGSGLCNLYDSQVFQTVITGDYADVKATAFVPLIRNEYNVSASISGTVPTITGVCDWSSSSKQTWTDPNMPSLLLQEPSPSKEESSNWNKDLYKPQIDQRVFKGEKYYLKYSDGIQGLQSSWIKTGVNRTSVDENEAINNYAPNNQNPTTAVAGADAVSESVIPMQKPSALDLANIVELVTDDVSQQESSKYFLGGWPIKNQASTQTDLVNYQGEKAVWTSFSDQYVVVKAADKSNEDLNKILSSLFKNDTRNNKKQIAFLPSNEATKFVDNVRTTQSNIKDITVDTLQLVYNKSSNTFQLDMGGKTISYSKAKVWGKKDTPEELKSGGKVTFLYYKIEYNAAACQACVPTPADEMVDKPVLFYHENYLQFAQVDWQMRSGDFHFEVPYLDPGLQINHEGTTVQAKHWSEYISASFVTQGLGKYTGHYTAHGETFIGSPTQIGCPEEQEGVGGHDSKSRFPKIVDYQIGFGKDASYRKLKDLGSNEILFDRKSSN